MAIKLTTRQRVFIKKLVWSDPPITQAEAARQAGYEDKDASHAGYQLLKRPQVKAAYERQLAQREELIKLDALRIAEETKSQALANLSAVLDADGNLAPFKDWPDEVKRSLQKIEVEDLHEGSGEDRRHIGVLRKIWLHDKRASQELFLKWAGKLKDKLELEAPGLTLDQLVPKRKPLSTEGSK
jgi:phage terminase small subunit